MVSKISPRNFSHEDKPRAGRPQKIKIDELQALLDINSAKTEKELAEQFDVTQQAISVHLHTMGKIQKECRWVSHKFEDKNRRHDTAPTLLSKFRKKIFYTKSLQAMKSGFFMITLNVENYGLTLINLGHQHQSPTSTPRRFCSVSGGIGKMCCITSCYRVKQSRQIATNNS